ncbi:MAG: hypothetical protein HY454_01895 [Parcubacteria group bacterium]|nr:hypothetical protein [Parcubacteria group bacterium]
MLIRPLNGKIERWLKRFNLADKFAKQKIIFESNILHPGLNVEKLEPKNIGLYSFRVDKKYRAIFRIRDGSAEIIHITKHYEK